MHLRDLAVAALAGAAAASSVHAAPLDALLTALPDSAAQATQAAPRWQLEAGTDHANRRLDVLGLRPKRADGSSGPSGVYSGGHLLLQGQPTPSLRIDAGLWKRSIAYVSAAADVTTWQLAAQWQPLRWSDGDGALAVRANAWSNRAPLLRRTTSAKVEGIVFTSAQATEPRDAQLQLDLLASWRPASSVLASAFVGIGRSHVTFDRVSATTGKPPACVYDVAFTDGKVIATCEQGGSTTRVSTPAAVYGIDVDSEARYTARSIQAGANAVWLPGNWRLRAGVQHIRIDRGSVDSVVRNRGGAAFTDNTIGVADIGYRVLPATVVFVRAQLLAHQFVGEVPMMYNTLTATQHRRRYGIGTLGLQHGF